MHCVICDKNLKDHESVRRHGITGEFLDLCDGCLREIPGLPTKGGQGLTDASDPFEDTDDSSNIGDVTIIDNVTNCYNLDDEEH
jgi:hypothetical protein